MSPQLTLAIIRLDQVIYTFILSTPTMIATLTGQVAEKEAKHIIINVNGLGYKVSVPSSLSSKIKKSVKLTLRIHHHVSADSEDLYGFANKNDLAFFELLLTVPSIGPRTAMGILEVAPPLILRQAVTEGDTALLTKVSGVGRRTAERIIVELREKIAPLDINITTSGVQRETMEALVSIGYTKLQAREAVQKLPKGLKTVEEAVKAALQQPT